MIINFLKRRRLYQKNRAPIIILFFLAFLLRLTRLIPNMELVTTSLVLSSFYLSRKHTLLFTLITLIATDLLLGNTNIFIFTWTGFLLPIFLSKLLIPQPFRSLSGGGPSIFKLIRFGIISNVFFYLWTNFGVWLLDSWGMYPHTLPGLISCYINALPFLKNQICSSLLFIPLFQTLIKQAYHILRRNQLSPYQLAKSDFGQNIS
jgi:hypothetical protein